jgi:hypothetical protein
MELDPIEGKPVRFPPGRVEIRLNPKHRSAYRALYARYQSILAGLPVLRERDFDGRPVHVTANELEALRRAFAGPSGPVAYGQGTAFESQEALKEQLFKKLQYLS